MPWYTYDTKDSVNASGAHVSVLQEAFYTGAGNVTQIACTNPSVKTAFIRVWNFDANTGNKTTVRYYHEFGPGSTRQNSGTTLPAGTVTPVQDPDNPASWGILEPLEFGLL